MQTHVIQQGHQPQARFIPSAGPQPLQVINLGHPPPPPRSAHAPPHYASVASPVHHVAPSNPQMNVLATVPTSRTALDQQLRSKVISLLASTANGCITEIGYGQLVQRLKTADQELFSLKASYDVLFRENQRLVAEAESSTNLRAENQKLREQYEKLASDYKTGSIQYNAVCGTYQDLSNHYRTLRAEKDAIRREKDTLQREVNILRNTRSLSADQQYLLLDMKYNKVLDLLKTQTVEGSRYLNRTPPEPPMHSLYPMPQSGLPQRRASEPVKASESQAALPQQVLRPIPQRITTSVAPSQSIQSAPIITRETPRQLPSPVESSSSAGPSVPTPLSRLRRDHARRLSDSVPVPGQPRSMSMPLDFQSLPSSSHEPRSQSIPHQGQPSSHISNPAQSHSVPSSLPTFSWAPVKPEPSTSRASPIPHMSNSPHAGSVQGNVEVSHLSQSSSPIALDNLPNTHFSGFPSPLVPDASPKVEAAGIQIDGQPPTWSDPPGAPSNTPDLVSSEATAMDSSPDVPSSQQHAYISTEGTSSAEEWKLSRQSPLVDDNESEPKPMISDDGTLLVNNGAPPPSQDHTMAEGGNGDDEEEEDYSDLTDDEGPDGTQKAPPIECCSEVFYDDEFEERHCQMCETRVETGLTDEQPQNFTESSLRELITHLKTSHLVAWDGLRARSGQIKEELGD